MPRPPSADELAHWLTRPEAADLLHVSERTIINWTAAGDLHPAKRMRPPGRRGVLEIMVFDPRELTAIARRRHRPVESESLDDPGEITARAFEAFDDGGSIRDAVRKCRRPYAEVMVLREQWLDAGGADLVIASTAKRELVQHLGEFDDIAELVELVGQQRELHDELLVANAELAAIVQGGVVLVSPSASVMVDASVAGIAQPATLPTPSSSFEIGAAVSERCARESSGPRIASDHSDSDGDRMTIMIDVRRDSALARATSEEIEAAIVAVLDRTTGNA